MTSVILSAASGVRIIPEEVIIVQNRVAEIWKQLDSFIEQRSVSDVILAIQKFEDHAEELVAVMRKALRQCNSKAVLRRSCGKKGETAFIVLSFLDSSVTSGKFDLRIDFMDSNFLADVAEAESYFPYLYLKPIFEESVAAICAEAKKKLVRFMDYECDAIADKYKDDVLYTMVISVCTLCLLHPEMKALWQELTLSQECFFTFGRLFNDQQLFLKVPRQKDATS